MMRISNRRYLVVSLAGMLLMSGLSRCNKDLRGIDIDQINDSRVLNSTPPGKNIRGSESLVTGAQSFSSKDKVVATYYYDWYNSATGDHLDSLTDHPASDALSYDNVEWQKQQLEDMIDAGIDVVLPVYWGNPEDSLWSVQGLGTLVEAWKALNDSGLVPPKIGMFYDTRSLAKKNKFKNNEEKADLTTLNGKEYFYKMIRDFYSLIPTAMRARMDLKPFVWLSPTEGVEKYDQEDFDFANDAFSLDFGGNSLYIVREQSWDKVTGSDWYAWGTAQDQPSAPASGSVISIGPGKTRDGGAFYGKSWQQVLDLIASDSTKNIIAIESWNDYQNGTDIADSKEYGRQYIDTTRAYTTYIRQTYSSGPADKKEAYLVFDKDGNHGIENIQQADGQTSVVKVAGVACLKSENDPYNGHLMYFKIDDDFKQKKEDDEQYELTITYYDNANTGFSGNYDSFDPTATLDGAYKGLPHVATTGSNGFKKFSVILSDARFEGRENGGADFRLQSDNLDLRISRVAVELVK